MNNQECDQCGLYRELKATELGRCCESCEKENIEDASWLKERGINPV